MLKYFLIIALGTAGTISAMDPNNSATNQNNHFDLCKYVLGRLNVRPMEKNQRVPGEILFTVGANKEVSTMVSACEELLKFEACAMKHISEEGECTYYRLRYSPRGQVEQNAKLDSLQAVVDKHISDFSNDETAVQNRKLAAEADYVYLRSRAQSANKRV